MRFPNTDELQKIRSVSRNPDLDASRIFVLGAQAFDTKVIKDRDIAFTPNALVGMAKRANVGETVLLVGHDTREMPRGRSFQSEVMGEGDSAVLSAAFYVPANEEMSKLEDSISLGIQRDVSGGVRFETIRCGICGTKFGSKGGTWCGHWPGEKYGNDEDEGGKKKCVFYVEESTWNELSLVYDGAVDSAQIKRDFSPEQNKWDSNFSMHTQEVITLSKKEDPVATPPTETPPAPAADLAAAPAVIPTPDPLVGINAEFTRLHAELAERDKLVGAKDAEIAALKATIEDLGKYKAEKLGEIDKLRVKLGRQVEGEFLSFDNKTFEQITKLGVDLSAEVKTLFPGGQRSIGPAAVPEEQSKTKQDQIFKMRK